MRVRTLVCVRACLRPASRLPSGPRSSPSGRPSRRTTPCRARQSPVTNKHDLTGLHAGGIACVQSLTTTRYNATRGVGTAGYGKRATDCDGYALLRRMRRAQPRQPRASASARQAASAQLSSGRTCARACVRECACACVAGMRARVIVGAPRERSDLALVAERRAHHHRLVPAAQCPR